MNKTKRVFGGKPGAVAKADVKNYEGTPAFTRSKDEQLVNVLMTGTFEDTFYADVKTLMPQALDIFKEYAGNDPAFLAKASIYARNEGLMRISPITAVAVLSTSKNKEAFHEAFKKVICNPGDLQDFVQIMLSGKVREGMGRSVKKAQNDWLGRMTEYWAIKYGSEKQELSLRDVYRLARPKFGSGKASDLAKYVVHGEYVEGNYSQIDEFEKLKKCDGNEDLAIQCIRNGRLPYEQVTAVAPNTKGVWRELLHQAPVMNLIRNINNFQKKGVFDDKEEVKYAVGVLTDPNRIAKSKQFPFRFYSAIRSFSGNQNILEALYQAMDLSVGNMPKIGDSVLVCNDVSGSMDHSMSSKSSVTMMDIAGIFAASCLRSTGEGKIVSFNEDAIPRRVYKKDSVMSIAEKVSRGGGGTNLSAPIQHLSEMKERVDTAIFITDSESWVEFFESSGRRYNFGFGLGRTYESGKISLDYIRQYKRKLNPNLKCFFMQLVPYNHAVVPPSEPDCYYIYGWSPNVLRYISSICNGGAAQVESIKSMELAIPSSQEEESEEE